MSLPREIPNDPTPLQCQEALGWSYTEAGVRHVWTSRNRALDGNTPESLMGTVEGRRKVYGWALSLAEGVMG